MSLGIATGGLSSGETEETLQAFLDQTGVTFPIVWDNDSYNNYDWPPAISPYPRQALVDREGIITYLAAEYQAQALDDAIRAAL